MIVKNKGEAPLRLKITAGRTELEAGTPVGTLRIRVKKARSFDLAPGASSPEFAVAQEGERRPVDGKFMISMYEGAPLFSGNVTMGTVGR
jgi:hypothetical protein